MSSSDTNSAQKSETLDPEPAVHHREPSSYRSQSSYPEVAHRLTYNNDHPCGYAQHMLLSVPLVLALSNGLDPQLAALAEPLAVGVHAVAKSCAQPGDTAMVIGLRTSRPGHYRGIARLWNRNHHRLRLLSYPQGTRDSHGRHRSRRPRIRFGHRGQATSRRQQLVGGLSRLPASPERSTRASETSQSAPASSSRDYAWNPTPSSRTTALPKDFRSNSSWHTRSKNFARAVTDIEEGGSTSHQ